AISAYIKHPVPGVLPEIARRLPWQYRRQLIQTVAAAHAVFRKEGVYDSRGVALERDVRSVLGAFFYSWQIIDRQCWSESDGRSATSALKFAISGNFRRA